MTARVRAHKVTRNGTTYTRSTHSRNQGGRGAGGMKLRPRRAWTNAKRAHLSMKQRKRIAAGLFAAAAVTEITAFTVFRGVGGFMFVAGAGIALIGYGLVKT